MPLLKTLAITLSTTAALFGVTSSTLAAVVNDGTTTTGLTLVSNIPYLTPEQTYPSSSTMTVDSGTLRMENGNHFQVGGSYSNPAVRAAWVSDVAPASTTLTVTADIKSNVLNDADRGGVIILNSTNNKGVIIYVKPATNEFRIATLDLNQQIPTDTTRSTTGAGALPGFVGTNLSTYSLTITPNGSNTDVSASITQGANTYTLSGSYALGDIVASSAANIRVGYFGYFPANAEEGYTIGNFDNLTLTPVPEPAVTATLALGSLAMLGRVRGRSATV